MPVINNKPAVIKAALALDQVCYYWSITLDPETALTLVSQCQEINAATQATLVELIEKINEYLPRIEFGPDNPNTGQMHHEYIIGSEGSRFIDLKLHKSYLKQWGSEEWQNLSNFLYLLGRAYYADIMRVTEEDTRNYVFSFWWD